LLIKSHRNKTKSVPLSEFIW